MAELLPRPPPLRRVPGGWVGFLQGAAWPVEDPAGAAGAADALWSFDGGRLLVAPGKDAAAGVGPPVDRLPASTAGRATAYGAAPVALARAEPKTATANPVDGFTTGRAAAHAQLGALPGLRLLRGDLPALHVPRAWLEQMLPMPAISPLPFAPPGIAGLTLAAGGVLLLDGPAALPLLAVLRVEGRLVGLACAGARPDADAGDGGWLPRGALALAPRMPEPEKLRPAPSTALLFCQAGGLEFALPALEVEAVLAPVLPTPGPPHAALRGVVAHRGGVLPVLDAGSVLGGPPALAGLPVPMLRLAGPAGQPVALAVAAVDGLRQVADSAISPADATGPLRATCWPAAAAIPVLDPAWLCREA